jgi:hypothetical protein
VQLRRLQAGLACRLKLGLAWLLAAAVLLGSVAPPAVEHAHADGERAHDHGAADLHEGQHKLILTRTSILILTRTSMLIRIADWRRRARFAAMPDDAPARDAVRLRTLHAGS